MTDYEGVPTSLTDDEADHDARDYFVAELAANRRALAALYPRATLIGPMTEIDRQCQALARDIEQVLDEIEAIDARIAARQER